MYINDILALVKSLWLWEEYVTVLFSVNTEKVRLRRLSFPEVYGEPEDAEQPGFQPGCGRRGESRARGGWALPRALPRARPRGEAPGTPKPDSAHPDGMRLRGGAGKGSSAPGWEGNQSFDQNARGDPGSGGTGRAPCSTFRYLHLIIWLKSECNPSTTGFYSRKGTFWAVTEGDSASHLLGSFPDGTARHCGFAHITWFRLIMPQFALS